MDEPRRLGDRYELGEVIGRGGMAEVHLGSDLRLGRSVAIKVLRPDLARDPSFQARFRREAQSAAALNHPNVVSVYDTGEAPIDGQQVPYIVMEHVDGATVRDLVRSGRPLEPVRALEITDGILGALDYSHRNGIVHRDIKPGNVMVTKGGAIKVTDFGIARALADSAATMTSTSSVMGTAQYLSPEQARGEQVDARSDLYSTGVVLFEMLTGRAPFLGDSPVSVAYQHVREEPPVPSTLAPGIPPACDAIVAKALAKDAEARYQTAAQMRADVQRALRGAHVTPPVAAAAVVAAADSQATQALPRVEPPAGPGEPPAKKSRTGWVIAGVVLAVLLALGGIVWALTSGGGAKQVRVPDLTGLTVPQAQTELQLRGLVLGDIRPEVSDLPKDTIVGQDPPSSETADEGSAVDVQVSSGPGEVAVPTLVGLDKDAAVAQLNGAGLQLAGLTEQDSTRPCRPGPRLRSEAGHPRREGLLGHPHRQQRPQRGARRGRQDPGGGHPGAAGRRLRGQRAVRGERPAGRQRGVAVPGRRHLAARRAHRDDRGLQGQAVAHARRRHPPRHPRRAPPATPPATP